MSEEGTHHRKQKQFNLNSVISSGVGVMLLIMGWEGKALFDRTQADIQDVGKKLAVNNDAVVELKVTVGGLKDSVKECVLRSEFAAEVSRLNREIDGLRSERRHTTQ